MTSINRYLFYILYFIFTIPMVIFFFKFIEPKKLASLFAASLFISCSLFVFWGEFRNKSKKSLTLLTALGFLIIFSGPMLIGRLIHYDLDFSEIKFGPLDGPEFHKYSNYGFTIMLVAAFVDYVRLKSKGNLQK